MADFTGMLKPQLIEHAMRLGHRRGILERMSLEMLRKLCNEGQEYNGSTPEPSNAPGSGNGPDAPPNGAQGAQSGADGQGQGQSGQTPPPSQIDVEKILKMAEDRIIPKADLRDRKTAEDVTRKIMADVAAEIAKIEAEHPRETIIHVVNAPTSATAEPLNVGMVHCQFSRILKWHLVNPNNEKSGAKHVYIYGPKGLGKTTLAKQVNDARATALGLASLPFYMFNCHKSLMAHDLTGYMTPDITTGVARYVTTPFREWCDNGGTLLLDEFDKAGMLTGAIHAALANGYAMFPDKSEPVRLHVTCRALATGNTVGLGPDQDYVSCERLDAATRDRFVFIGCDYDEALELALAGTSDRAIAWCKHVQHIRRTILGMGASAPDLCPGTRAILTGADVLSVDPNIAFADLENDVIWQGADADTIAKVRRAAKL